MTVSNPNATATSVLPICIAGEWRLGTGERYVTRYPATGEVVAELNAASVADVEEAVAGAYRAFLSSGWAQRKPHERAAVLYRVAELIRSRSEARMRDHAHCSAARPHPAEDVLLRESPPAFG